jgi:hypothetical protein
VEVIMTIPIKGKRKEKKDEKEHFGRTESFGWLYII